MNSNSQVSWGAQAEVQADNDEDGFYDGDDF